MMIFTSGLKLNLTLSPRDPPPSNLTNIWQQIGVTIFQVTMCYLKFTKMLSRIGMLLGSKSQIF